MTTPISGLDHVVLLTRDLAAAVADYQTLLGCAVAWRSRADGAETALFTLPNSSIELIAPAGSGTTGERVAATLDQQGEGLASLCFRVSDAQRMYRRLQRLGLQPEAVAASGSTNLIDGTALQWHRTRAAAAATHGVKQFFLAREAERPLSSTTSPAPVIGLDHVVIATGDAERAAALYGARLGLDMALDLSRPDWGARLMFFRCGDLIVEIAQKLHATDSQKSEQQTIAPPPSDRLMGLSWRVADAVAAQAHLAASGFDVSEVRQGRKPGTSIFSVRTRTAGVPTVMIQQPARDEAV
jgi:catechol 2,3-dioxygenase-like lactoylglutathione lyase family enzyme